MKTPLTLLVPALIWAGTACGKPATNGETTAEAANATTDDSAVSSADSKAIALEDSIVTNNSADRYDRLTNEEFRIVAEQLGVEVAAIKAVVEIEAGKAMQGFLLPGVPVINFDPSVYRLCLAKAKGGKGVNDPVPEGLSGYGLKEWKQLINARKKNADAANMGTFWGMFQIGGFNYELCGYNSVDEFVQKMSESEFAQLEIFATFIEKCGMLDDLRKKNWSGFARRYNGNSYAARGYHTKMANAYRRYKNDQ